MEATYDENLSENIFLRTLETNYSDIFKKSVDNNWIICVPRTGSFENNYIINENDVSGHVLIPQSHQDDSEHTHQHQHHHHHQTFQTIAGNKILLENRHLNFQDHEFNNKTSRLLFEETFYTDNLLKYTVWCIERPLTPGSVNLDNNDVVILSNVGDCMNFLWTEVDDKNVFRDLDNFIETFENSHKNSIDKNSINIQRQLIEKLYHECLNKIISIAKLQEKITTSPHYYRTIKLAVESYVLYGLRNLLPGAVSTNTSQDDAKLNKIIKNLYELELKDLTDISHDIQAGIARGKIELSRLDTFVTVLGKVGCLKHAVHLISENIDTISSDDLLPILIYIVVRTGLPNWIAQLEFMKQFRFSADAINETDEVGFLITSLEAAVEHIKSGELSEQNLQISLVKSLDDASLQDKPTTTTVDKFFSAVRKCDLDEIERILNQKKQISTLESKLCHPLCRCENCESSFTEIQLAQSSWPSVNSKDNRSRTALHIASLWGHVAVVDFLLIHHADPNATDVDGVTPLHCAALRGHQNTVLLLLHANADPRLLDNRGNSPLHFATDSGHENCVKALLYFSEQMGVSINTSCANNVGDTPLHHAVKWGFMTIVEILLEHGANKCVANRRGQTPLTVAHSSHILRRLEEHPDTIETVHRVINRQRHQHSLELKSKIINNNKKRCEESPEKVHQVDKLLAAICRSDIRLACYYLGLEGPSVKASDNTTPRLCHPLCVCEKCEPTEEISDQHNRTIVLGLNVTNARGETALHYACAVGLVELVQILLDAGANVNARTTNKHRTPLHVACLKSKIHAVKLLLNCCTININVKDYTGDTPLHLSAKNGDSHIIELLLRHGADVHSRNFKGASALDEVQDVFCMKILTSHCEINKTNNSVDIL